MITEAQLIADSNLWATGDIVIDGKLAAAFHYNTGSGVADFTTYSTIHADPAAVIGSVISMSKCAPDVSLVGSTWTITNVTQPVDACLCVYAANYELQIVP
jgi:hypothetical protein